MTQHTGKPSRRRISSPPYTLDRSFRLGCLIPIGASLSLGIAVATAAEAPTSGSVRTLSLNDCFQLALKHNLDLQIERLNTKIQGYQLSGSYAAYDPSFTFGASKNYLDQPGSFDPKKILPDNAYKLSTDSLAAGVIGKLPTGMSYQLGGGLDQLHAMTPFGPAFPNNINFPPDGTRRTNQFLMNSGITIRQPLLKNLWIDSDRLQIQVSKKNLQISELGLTAKVMNTVSAVQQTYYDAWLAQQILAVQQAALVKALQMHEDARLRIKNGSLVPFEETLYQFNVENVRGDVMSAESAAREEQSSLRNLIADDLKDWIGGSIQVTENPAETAEQFDQIGSWRAAMVKRPDVQQAELDLQKQDILLRFDRNQLYPSLDLVGSYGVQSADPSLSTTSGEIGNANHSKYSYGIVLSVPFSNQGARSKYKANQEERHQALLRMKQMEMGILTQVEHAGRLMETAYTRIESTRQARIFAEEVLKSEENKIQMGGTSSFVIVESRRRLTTAAVAEAKARADYAKASAQLSQGRGEILERNAINLNFK